MVVMYTKPSLEPLFAPLPELVDAPASLTDGGVEDSGNSTLFNFSFFFFLLALPDWFGMPKDKRKGSSKTSRTLCR